MQLAISYFLWQVVLTIGPAGMLLLGVAIGAAFTTGVFLYRSSE